MPPSPIEFIGTGMVLPPVGLAPVLRSTAKSPSTDLSSAVPLELREIVSGRLQASQSNPKAHYWLFDLPAGNYKVVLDVRRTDDRILNLLGSLDLFWLDGRVDGWRGSVNEIDSRARCIFPLRLDLAAKGILSFRNDEWIVDYQLAIVPSAERVPGPFFENCPPVSPLEVGQTATIPLLGGPGLAGDAYYSLRLAPGDYDVCARFERTNGQTGFLAGNVDVYDADGANIGFLNGKIAASANDVAVGECQRMSLAEAETRFLRVRARDAQQKVVFSVRKVY
jgi:hypothetical protein